MLVALVHVDLRGCDDAVDVKRVRTGAWLTCTAALLCCAFAWPSHGAEPRAVATFECVGLYWRSAEGATDKECTVRFRAAGEKAWRQGLPLWFDKRNGECRGSIVGLRPGTTWEIELRMAGTDGRARLKAKTWPEQFPIAKTVRLKPGTRAEPLVITEGGKPGSYVLYEGSQEKPTVIDVAGKRQSCVDVRASYVVVRGLTLKNAGRNGVRLDRVHDVVIERCDISGWGRRGRGGYGLLDGGIECEGGRKSFRLVIQRNRIHNPRANTNAWDVKGESKANDGYHPYGPQGMVWVDGGGNNVIRYNAVTSDDGYCYNDGIGGGRNFGKLGFPGRDSDVYGNVVTHCNDDGLEIEGGSCNVRVWGNYIDSCMSGIATTTCSVGPLYVFRNVYARSRWRPYPGGNTDALFFNKGRDRGGQNRGFFSKVAQNPKDSGRQYWFHNTMLQPPPPEGRKLTLGARWGLHRVGGHRKRRTGISHGVFDFVSYNNIWHVAHTADEKLVDRPSIEVDNDSRTNVMDYDLYNGTIRGGCETIEKHGVRGLPVYAKGHGPQAGSKGTYQLKPGGPGHDAGKRIPNVNDGFLGKGPDIGAHETGSKPMQFGVDAYCDGKTGDAKDNVR